MDAGAPNQPAPKKELAPRLDLYGDPLPPGAIARLGTVRWRHPEDIVALGFADNDRALVSVGNETVRVWRVSDGKLLCQIGKRHFGGRGAADFPSVIRCAAVSPDGQTLAIAGEDFVDKARNLIVLWQLPSGKRAATIEEPDPDSISGCIAAIAYSPGGKQLATRSLHSTQVKIWDVAGRKLRQQIGEPYKYDSWEGSVHGDHHSLSFSPDGGKVAALSEIGEFAIWELKSKKAIVRRKDKQPFAALAFSRQGDIAAYQPDLLGPIIRPDGTRKAPPPGPKKKAGIYFARQFKLPDQWFCPVAGYGTRTLAISPDGKSLAVSEDILTEQPGAGGSYRLSVWDAPSARQLWQSAPLALPAPEIAYSADGRLLAATIGSVVRLWDAKTGKEITADTGHGDEVWGVSASPDGKMIVTRSQFDDRAEFRAWSLPSGKQVWKMRGGASYTLAFSPDGLKLAGLMISEGATRDIERVQYDACLFHAASGKIDRVIPSPLTQPAGVGGMVQLLGGRGGVGTFQAATLFLDGRLDYDATADVLGFAQGGKVLMTLQIGPVVCYWDVATGKEIRRVPVTRSKFDHFRVSPDGRRVCLSRTSKEKDFRQRRTFITVRDLELNRAVCRLDVPAWSRASNLFSADTRSLVLSRFFGFNAVSVLDWPKSQAPFCLIETHTGKVRRLFSAKGPDGSEVSVAAHSADFAISPDGHILAAVWENKIYLWDTRTGKVIGSTPDHGGWVTCLAFSSDGAMLISSSEMSTLVWDVAAIVREPLKKPPTTLTPKQLNALWQDLANDDAEKAFDAICALAEAPDQAVALLRKKLRPAPAVDQQQVRQWIADLASKKFTVRQKATRGLEDLGEPAEALLVEALKTPPDLEVKLRLDKLLDRIQSLQLPPAQIQQLRAAEVLERIGSKDAIAVLRQLATGEPAARLTQDAKASLERLGVASPAP